MTLGAEKSVLYSVSHESNFQKYGTFFGTCFQYVNSLPFCIENPLLQKCILHHKMNSPCFISSLEHWNAWIHPCLWRFNLAWSPSLFYMEPQVVYLASLIWSLVLIITFYLFLGIYEFYLLIKYDKVVLRCLKMHHLSFYLYHILALSAVDRGF
jgi:hypothetical protein